MLNAKELRTKIEAKRNTFEELNKRIDGKINLTLDSGELEFEILTYEWEKDEAIRLLTNNGYSVNEVVNDFPSLSFGTKAGMFKIKVSF